MSTANPKLSFRVSGGRRRTRGSVILIVLITIVFASLALGVFIEKASNDLLVEAREINATRLRLEAYSALEMTLGVLEEFRSVNKTLHSPAEGWSDPLAFANYQPGEGRKIEITFEDESGKFSLPNVQQPTLINLFKSWDLSSANSEKLADALLGWMKKDYVPTGSGVRPGTYDQGSLPFGPPARSLRSFSELATIEYAREIFFDEAGKPNDLFDRFKAAFSLYDYKTANINGPNPALLAGLGITDSSQQRSLNDYLLGTGAYEKRGPQYFKTAEDVAKVLGPKSPAAQLGIEMRALRVIVVVREGQSVFRLNTVIAPSNGAKLPATSAPTDTKQEGTTAAPSADKSATNADPANKAPKNPKTGSTASTGGSDPAGKKLNYPFTLLEIRENDEIPSAKPATATF